MPMSKKVILMREVRPFFMEFSELGSWGKDRALEGSK